ncbi:Mlo-related protein - like 10 [Theobroma cacao]|nr:Mlo-related protein - like 10 [Theobroma cacao]
MVFSDFLVIFSSMQFPISLLEATCRWYSYLWLPFIPLIHYPLIINDLGMRLTAMIWDEHADYPASGNQATGDHNQNGAQNSGERRGGERSASRSAWRRPFLVQPTQTRSLSYQLCSFPECLPACILCMDLGTILVLFEFGLKSCFHEHVEDVVIRISMGVLVQILCSYVTLPLYALVTQMGSNMKPTIFNERVATALRKWHHTAKKHIKQNKGSGTPFSSRPNTPSQHTSPVHLLRNYRSEMDSLHTSPRRSNFDIEHWDTDSPSPSHPNYGDGSSSHHHNFMAEQVQLDYDRDVVNEPSSSEQHERTQHEINIGPKEFSFDRRTIQMSAYRLFEAYVQEVHAYL